jgi:hypothetical protein
VQHIAMTMLLYLHEALEDAPRGVMLFSKFVPEFRESSWQTSN